jgi:outer membrane protein assembly factor BamB
MYVSTTNRLYALTADCVITANCSPVWSASLSETGGSARQIMINDGKVYVLTTNGHLRQYGL